MEPPYNTSDQKIETNKPVFVKRHHVVQHLIVVLQEKSWSSLLQEGSLQNKKTTKYLEIAPGIL